VVFAMKQAAESMKRPDNLYIAGGGGTSVVWRQIFADVFQRPVCFTTTGDLSSYGAALIALKMLGVNIAGFVMEKNTLHPNIELAELYQRQYERFLKIYPALQSIYAG